MADLRSDPTTWAPLAPEGVVCAEALERVVLSVAARALARRDCADLDTVPLLGRYRGVLGATRRRAVAAAAVHQAVPLHRAGDIDAEAVARWFTGHYPGRSYPAVVLGSPHGAAAHLAAALAAPWLPTGFTTRVRWSQGGVDRPGSAMLHGVGVAARLTARNPGLCVRQIHDPVQHGAVAGSVVTLHLRWQGLPAAYRNFLDTRIAHGAAVLLLRDTRTWPVLDLGAGHTFQVGGPVGGWDPSDYADGSAELGQLLGELGADPANWGTGAATLPERYAERGVEPGLEEDLRRWTASRERPLHRVLYPSPPVLSAAVADVLRARLRDSGKTGNRCVVDSGPLLDPWHTVRAGLVPYWCESGTRPAVTDAEWWLAGSARFTSVEVVPAPPGVAHSRVAGMAQWRALAAFGARRGNVDRAAARSYPLHPLPTGHATEVLRRQPYDLPAPPRLRAADAVAGLRSAGTAMGLLVC